MNNKKIDKMTKYKELVNHYTNSLSDINSLISSAETEFSSITISDKKSYLQKKKILKKINKYIVLRNLICGNKTKYTLLYQQEELLQKYNVETPNDAVLNSLISVIESSDYLNDIPYGKFKIHHLNTWTKRVNKARVKKIYITNKLKTNIPNWKRKTLEYNSRFLDNKISSLEGYINDLKGSFFAKYHAEQVTKLEKAKKNHGIKSMASNYIIDLKDVTKYYNNGALATKVLKGVNLQIKSGEFVVILGPSGSGKTTLLNIISGMDTATYGTAIVCGDNLTNFNSNELTNFRRKNIGYVFQQYGLLPNLTIKENVEIGANLNNSKTEKINVDDLLKTIGIFEHRNKLPHELSGGQQQRVSIARSIAKNPSIIFGDEPTGAIDEKMSKQVMQLFLDINKKYKTTIIIVTHNPIFAEMATVVINVLDGKINKITYNKNPKSVAELNWTEK